MIILANPNNPSGTLVAVDELRRLCDAGDQRNRRRRRGVRRLRPGGGHRREPAALPGAPPEPGRAAHDVEELQPGGRPPRACCSRRRRWWTELVEGQGQLQRQRRSPRRSVSPRSRIAAVHEDVHPPNAGPARASGARARRRSVGRGGRIGRQLPMARSASAPRRTAPSRGEELRAVVVARPIRRRFRNTQHRRLQQERPPARGPRARVAIVTAARFVGAVTSATCQA